MNIFCCLHFILCISVLFAWHADDLEGSGNGEEGEEEKRLSWWMKKKYDQSI